MNLGLLNSNTFRNMYIVVGKDWSLQCNDIRQELHLNKRFNRMRLRRLHSYCWARILDLCRLERPEPNGTSESGYITNNVRLSSSFKSSAFLLWCFSLLVFVPFKMNKYAFDIRFFELWLNISVFPHSKSLKKKYK